MKFYTPLLFFICFYACTSSRNSSNILQKKLSTTEARADFTLAYNALLANHPSVYWYATKYQIDSANAAVINSITDSISIQQFRNLVASFTSIIRCGHTGVSYSKQYAQALSKQRKQPFSFGIKFIGDSAYITAVNKEKDSLLHRGAVVISIQNRPVSKIIDTLRNFCSTDGYANTFKDMVISNNFAGYYQSVFGKDSCLTILFKDSMGNIKNTTVRVLEQLKKTDSLQTKTVQKKPQPKPPKITKAAKLLVKRSLAIDTLKSTAYMQLSTFSSGNKLRKFFRHSFKSLHQLSIRHFVIDLRTNTGGSINIATNLSTYLSNHPFKVADSVYTTQRTYHYAKQIKPKLGFFLNAVFNAKKQSDGKFHMRKYEHTIYKPRKKNHFEGNIYYLTAGYTFSASTLHLSQMAAQKNMLIIGEETGGGFYGLSAVNTPYLHLPNSGLRVSIPMYRQIFDAERAKTGRGFMPHIYVAPNEESIRKGIDSKMEKAKAIIEEKSKGL